jgi:hypothetical protein
MAGGQSAFNPAFAGAQSGLSPTGAGSTGFNPAVAAISQG